MGSRILTLVASGLLALPPQASCAEEEQVYTSSFGEFVEAAKWSHTRTAVFPGNDRPFLGMFEKEEAATLTLAGLPEHQLVRVKVKLFLLRALDGNFANYGPDLWSFAADGTLIFNTSFSNVGQSVDGRARVQAFPDEYPAGGNRGGAGADERNSLGGKDSGGITKKNSVVHLEFVFAHRRPDLQLQFGSDFTEPVFDEAWGMEEVTVSVIPKAKKLTADELGALWNDLSGLSPSKAHRAVWKLVEAGQPAVEFLSERKKAMAAEPDGIPPVVEARIGTVLRAAQVAEHSFVVRASSSGPYANARLACDGKVARDSAETTPQPFRWTEGKGARQWLECRFDAPMKLAKAAVFWHEAGDVYLPESWILHYLDAAGKWSEVQNASAFGIEKDVWNETKFDLIETRALRLVVKQASGDSVKSRRSAGLSEFRFSE